MKIMSNVLSAALVGSLLLLAACPTDDGEDAGTEPEPTADAGEPEPSADAGTENFCPTRMKFSSLTDGIAHVGWSGFTHNVGPADGANFTVDVVQCDDECRNCRFEGPIFSDEVSYLRCESDSRVECDADSVCPEYACLPIGPGGVTLCSNNFSPCASATECDPGVCKIFWGGNSAAETTVSGFGLVFGATDGDAPVQGRIDLATGQLTFDRFGFQVTSSSAAIGGFPPVCSGDDVRADGVQNGTCSANPYAEIIPGGNTVSPYLGMPCDAHSGSPLPGRAGIYSLDCAVPLATALGFDMTTFDNGTAVQAVWTLEEGDQPACADGPCWCGVCEGSSTPCHSQDDCVGVPCVADVEPPGVAPRANACVDECSWDNETFKGTCNRVVGFEPDGGPPVLATFPCLPKGEDAAVIATGSSTKLDDRSYSIQTGVLGCAAASGNPTTNSIIGLPGPNVGLYKFRVDLE